MSKGPEEREVFDEKQFLPFVEKAGISRIPDKPNGYRVVEVSKKEGDQQFSAGLLGDFSSFVDAGNTVHESVTGAKTKIHTNQTPAETVMRDLQNTMETQESLRSKGQTRFFLYFDFEGNLMQVKDASESVK